MARNPALTRYDNNTPYDCTLAGEKQGSQEQFGRGATPLRFAKNNKNIMTLKLMLTASIIQITLVLYNEDEAFHNREPHHFVT
jgi:hypothetical protein